MVPHLTTSLTGPLHDLERLVLDRRPEIERWFRSRFADHEVPFYSSVDLRNSGFKLAPVDTNLFPGGFNNLNPDFLPLCVHAAMSAIQKLCPDAQKVILVPENHTRNLFYLQSVATLKRILEGAGLAVRIGSLIPDLAGPTEAGTAGGDRLLLEPLRREGNRAVLDGFDPCAVIVNNDLSGGVPAILEELEQTVVPPLIAGWSTRRKSRHFHAYDGVAEDFAELLGIDPWFVNPVFSQCGQVDFAEKAGEDCLAANVEYVLDEVREKYRQYGITEAPFAIVKADAGTYGMGIMTVKSVDDVRNLNRKTRNKMSVIKEGQPVNEVIIQEGVYTFEDVDGAVAEPVVYMIDQFVVGGFYRVHNSRGKDENLNSPGMEFRPLAFETDCHSPDCAGAPGDPPNRFYTYGVVARLANLAAAIEIEEMTASAEEPAGRRPRMKFAFVLDPLAGLKPKKDSSIAMMREAARRGHEVYALGMADLFVQDATVLARAVPLAVDDNDAAWCREGRAEEVPLSYFDLVAMRKDPPFDAEYYYATLLLERAQAEGALVVNSPRALRDWNEKLAILRFPQFTPPTTVSRDPARIHAFVDRHGDAILKKLDGMGGTMIFRVRKDDPNRNVIVETMVGDAERTIMAQKYVPEIAKGDKRVLVIDGRPFPHCLARIPRAGETRGNLAAGGTGVAQPLSARDREIGETVGAELVKAGIVFAGLDVIGDCLTEVNVTSPTCIVEIAQQTGENAAKPLLDAFDRLAAAPS